MKLNQRLAADQAIQWLSRTLAIVLFMIAPGFAGRALDRRLGTQFLTPLGFMLGTALATVVLVILARKLTEPAGEGEKTLDGQGTAGNPPSAKGQPIDRPSDK